MGIAAFVLSTLRRCTLLVCWTATSLWVLLGLAQAKDLETLSRMLIPAYMAQQFAAVCVVNNPSFLGETAGPQGHVHVYAKHVKEEVISELGNAAVEVVLRMAADTARSVVRAEMAQLPAGTLVEDSAHLLTWCEQSAKPYVREIMAAHAEKHSQIDRMLAEAKRD